MLLCPKELHVARSKIWFNIPAVLLWQDSGIYRAEVTEAASEMLGLLGLIFDAVATECITTWLLQEILISWPPCKHLLIALIDFKFVELEGIIMIL